MLGSIAKHVQLISESARAVGLLVQRGLIDPRRPDFTLQAARDTPRFGPAAALIRVGARRYGDVPVLADERGELTFTGVDRQSNALAHGLRELGLREGSVLGVLARDHRGLVLAMVAAGKLGARLVMLNTGFAKPQFAEVVAREHVQAVMYDSEFEGLLDALPESLPRVLTWVDGDVPDGVHTIESLAAGQPTTALPAPATAGGFIILTSGTTGLPKGAPRTSVSPLASAQMVDRIPFPRKDSVVIVSPLFHSTGLGTWFVTTALGNKTVLRRRFDPEATLRMIAEHRAKMLIAVPTMVHRMVELPAEVRKRYDTSSLEVILIAGSALSPELTARTREVFGDVLYNLYGSTEVAVATVATPQDLILAPGTAGRSPVTCEVALFDDEGRRITGNNRTGRIFVRSGAPFEGYTDGRHKQIIDGYMSSGDVGHFDSHGLLFIDGRDDDMIVSGGENVFPLEVENLLIERDDVFDAAVIGVDDPEFGKRLRAFVVRGEGATCDADEIRRYVKDNLARYKVPRDVVFLDELPRNPTGKLLRRVLAEMDVPATETQ
ncbi:acyl-CoA synthetase [Skermania sp. ID1734]|uniref:acyl-CoA synthetase n=1 Tax=Skermania sp. ID1734 TaxID=2597516 RepID=UPI0011804359|nr:acyl-CoA synthetase [Skermania sp. ID1734]TSD97243.1 acyl-CoA synthetase [Skermania sp. ID1734]